MSKRERTERQLLFLDHLFSDELRGKFRESMRKAGYSDNVKVSEVLDALAEDIEERARKQLTKDLAKASMVFGDAIDNPTDLGTKERIAAAKEVLDRVGIVKTEKQQINIESPNGIFILPPKNDVPRE